VPAAQARLARLAVMANDPMGLATRPARRAAWVPDVVASALPSACCGVAHGLPRSDAGGAWHMHSHGATVAAVARVVRSTWGRVAPATHPSQTLPGALLDAVRRVIMGLLDGLLTVGGRAVCFRDAGRWGRHRSKGDDGDPTSGARREMDAFA